MSLPSEVHFGEMFIHRKSEKLAGYLLRVGDSEGKSRKMILGGSVGGQQLSPVGRPRLWAGFSGGRGQAELPSGKEPGGRQVLRP